VEEHDETVSDPTANRSRLRPGKNPATIGAIATVLAAVVAGVFTLISTQESRSASPSGVATILAALPSGSAETGQATGSGGGTNGQFLADMNPVNAPADNDYSDTIGGRAVIKTVGIPTGSGASYSIPSGAKIFRASIGIGDKNGPPTADTKGTFAVFGDATLLEQVRLSMGQLAILSVPVTGYKILRLGYTAIAGDNTEGDFGMARFTS
jgi:NPCBM/NEW2 domain